MNWNRAERQILQMSSDYTKDSIRRITYLKEIFPLACRFAAGERSRALYNSITVMYQQLIFQENREEQAVDANLTEQI